MDFLLTYFDRGFSGNPYDAGIDRTYSMDALPQEFPYRGTGDFDMITFYGRHAMERNYQRMEVSHGNHVIGSRRGTSSHQYNPMMILAERSATECAGSCYAMSFVYSGNFKGEIEKDQFNQTRVLHDYVLGVYDFLERLIQRYPDMLIEGCSGGGGRFDVGMLYYTPQIWFRMENTTA